MFPVGSHVKHINGLTKEGSSQLLAWFLDLEYKNHDLQVRHKRQTPNDVGTCLQPVFDCNSSCWRFAMLTSYHQPAIWTNRSTFHSATFDYDSDRFGNRAVGIGERPYLDPNSTPRSAALVKERGE